MVNVPAGIIKQESSIPLSCFSWKTKQPVSQAFHKHSIIVAKAKATILKSSMKNSFSTQNLLCEQRFLSRMAFNLYEWSRSCRLSVS